MNSKKSLLPVIFSVVMLVFVLFLIWYLPSVRERRFQLQDVQLSLETSRGRERKQQHEYDETVAAIPEVQAELDRIMPLAEQAQLEVKNLKDERKSLREEKKKFESGLESSASQEVSGNE